MGVIIIIWKKIIMHNNKNVDKLFLKHLGDSNNFGYFWDPSMKKSWPFILHTTYP